MDIRADYKETNELLNTIFYEKPQYEILENGQKGRILSGYDGILLSGPFHTGKTLDILIAIRFTAMYQKATNNLRKIKVGVVRESNDSFVDNFASKIEIFNPVMRNRNGVDGYYIYDRNRRTKCTWRFRGQYPKGDGSYENDGTICEVEFHSFSVGTGNKADVEKWRGAEMTIMVFNEMNNYSEYCFDTLSPRKDRFPFNGVTYQYWIGDINPRLESDWDSRRFFKRKPSGVKVIQYENPLIWVPDESGPKRYLGKNGYFKENLQCTPRGDKGYAYWHQMTDGSDQSITNYVMGQYYRGKSGTAVHKYFNGFTHIGDVPAPDLSTVIVIAADMGFKNGFITGYFEDMIINPFDKNEVDYGSGKMFKVMDSFFGDGGWNKTWEKRVLPLFDLPEYKAHYEAGRIFVIADPRTIKKRSLTDGSQSIHIIEEADFNVAVPMNESQVIIDDIGYRVETTEKYLKQDRMMVHPRNRPLIDAFVGGYVTKGDSNEPDKKKSGGYAEVIDSLQYALTWKELGGDEEDFVTPLNFSRYGVTKKVVNLYNT